MVLKVALLGDTYPSQYRENPQALKDLEVVWSGASMEAFRAEVPARHPQVLVLDFADLSKVPEGHIPALMELTGAPRAIVTYRFAQRALVSRHGASNRIRILQGPISLNLLRAHIFLFALDDTLPAKRSPGDVPMSYTPPPTRTPAPSQSSTPTLAPIPTSTLTVPPKPPRYTPEQLGRLMEVASAVQCECPNHLAQLVTGLQAFENYSKQCESRDEKDREVHYMLYRQTAAAREVMEDALAALVKHERIQL
jgi:hypothetical protein